MANFPPLKARYLQTLDDALKVFKVEGRFLDFGCGQGDVALHLMDRHGLQGDLLDASQAARDNLRGKKELESCQVYENLSETAPESYDLITAFDVLEHLTEPKKVLNQFHKILKNQGLLALIVPYRPSTWGWDDDFYGHLRKWSLRGLIDSLEAEGFEILSVSDPTFPLYSFLRSSMLRIYKPTQDEGSAEERSERSSFENSWGKVPKWTKFIPWSYLNHLSRLSEHIFKGDEVFALAVKTNRSFDCTVCSRGQVTYRTTVGRHVVQRCRHCGSQRVAPGQKAKRKKGPKPIFWGSDLKRVRDILQFAPEARSLLHVGCNRGNLLKQFKSLGWKIQGLESREGDKTFPEIPIQKGTLLDVDRESFGAYDLIVLSGEIEFYDDLNSLFDILKDLLNTRGVVMIEMVDFSRITQKLLRALEGSMNLFNPQTICDQLANRNLALYHRRKLPRGRLQLWFRRQD